MLGFLKSIRKFCVVINLSMSQLLTISNAEYHSDTSRISKSGLDLIAKSPRHYYEKYLNPNRKPELPSSALILGNAIHCAILEPQRFLKEFAVMDDTEIKLEIGGKRPTNTNKYKEWVESFSMNNIGKWILSVEEMEMVAGCRNSVMEHGAASRLVDPEKIQAEKTLHFTDPETGAKCKIRPDAINSGRLIVDLKSTEDASPDGFGRSSLKYRYHVQAAFYMDAMMIKGYGEYGFVFIAVEKTPPYLVACYYVNSDTNMLGRATYQRDLRTYMECLESKEWPGYGDIITELRLPKYAFTQNSRE